MPDQLMAVQDAADFNQTGHNVTKATVNMRKLLCKVLEPVAAKRLSAEGMLKAGWLKTAAAEPLTACPVSI